MRAPDLVGSRAELRVDDTPGQPSLGSRFGCTVEGVMSDMDWTTSAGTTMRHDWALIVALDQPWVKTNFGFALLVPRDPHARLHSLWRNRVDVAVAPIAGVSAAASTDWNEVRVLARLRLLRHG